MNTDHVIRGEHFTSFHAGPKEDWTEYRQVRPAVPIPVRGKLFLRDVLNSAGLELSLNVLQPGTGLPFLHKHQENDEIYFVVSGHGQFLVDGTCLDIEEGSTLRISPEGERAIRNNSDSPLYFLCIQYRADSVVTGGTSDGRKVQTPLVWPDASSDDSRSKPTSL